ncbi:AmpG family muropeptide MFS transporter [Aurantivibrio infirmus]
MANTSATWLGDFKYYFHPRIVAIFFLGIAQGFPWVIISSGLTIWLKESGIDRATIGYAGAILIAYSINFLWAPMLDRFNLGPIGKLFGNRRAWILSMQTIIVLGCLIASNFSPDIHLRALIIVCIVVGFAAATQDIAIDAYRIESFPESEKKYLTAGSSMITAGWWMGYAGIGAFPIWLSNRPGWDWPDIYPLMAMLMVLVMIPTVMMKPRVKHQKQDPHEIENKYLFLFSEQSRARSNLLFILVSAVPLVALWSIIGFPGLIEEVKNWWGITLLVLCIETCLIVTILRFLWTTPDSGNFNHSISTENDNSFEKFLAAMIVTLVQPLKDFFKKNGVRIGLLILMFIFLFKIGEAFLGRMSLQFYLEIGFSKDDIALYSKLTTLLVTIVCSLLGGYINMRLGVVKGLFISGVAMAATNLLFSVIAQVGPDVRLYAFLVIFDGFAAAWSTVAVVSLISLLCDRNFTASQYALLASLGTLGRTLFASTSGLLVNWLNGNWTLFFVITALMVFPSLYVLHKLKPTIAALESSNQEG